MKFLSGVFIFSFIGIIKIYQIFFSPLFGKNCRFNPTCSNYAKLSIEKFGIFRGIYLIIKRLLRCHPWGNSGYDPVPDK
tara:strand:- start:208 stop:444 length:237 start_codon:yes stop_codon:yes gene_type:complete